MHPRRTLKIRSRDPGDTEAIDERLKYGGVPEEVREVVIRLDGKDRLAHVNSTWAEWSRKLERLHGAPKKYQERNGVVVSAFWTIPRWRW